MPSSFRPHPWGILVAAAALALALLTLQQARADTNIPTVVISPNYTVVRDGFPAFAFVRLGNASPEGVTLATTHGSITPGPSGMWFWEYTPMDSAGEIHTVTVWDPANPAIRSASFDLTIIDSVTPSLHVTSGQPVVVEGERIALVIQLVNMDPSGVNLRSSDGSLVFGGDGGWSSGYWTWTYTPLVGSAGLPLEVTIEHDSVSPAFDPLVIPITVLASPPAVVAESDVLYVSAGQTATNNVTLSNFSAPVVNLRANIGTVSGDDDGPWTWSYTMDADFSGTRRVVIEYDNGWLIPSQPEYHFGDGGDCGSGIASSKDLIDIGFGIGVWNSPQERDDVIEAYLNGQVVNGISRLDYNGVTGPYELIAQSWNTGPSYGIDTRYRWENPPAGFHLIQYNGYYNDRWHIGNGCHLTVVEAATFEVRVNDDDGDGIANDVDLDPTLYSSEFSDGQTYGYIGGRNGHDLSISDAPTPRGVRAASLAGPATPATIDACGVSTFELTPGDDIVVTCGSVTAQVISGPVEATFYPSVGDPVHATLVEDYVYIFYPTVGTVTTYVPVDIDIKPGSGDNTFNNNAAGVLPVAILSSPTFDASQVNPTSVKLNGLAVRVVGKGKALAHTEDVNADGLPDLVVQIEDTDQIFSLGDTTAALTGVTYSGVAITGWDAIRIVP